MKKIEIPKTTERIRGVTLPENGVVFVCDYDEVFKLRIGSVSDPEILDDDPYEFLNKQKHTVGVLEQPPIHEKNGNTINYNFNPTNDFVTVDYNIEGKVGIIKFRTLSGDWFAASFSKCGKYLILAEPYNFELYELEH